MTMIEVLSTIANMGDAVIFRFWNSETEEWVDLVIHSDGIDLGKSTDDGLYMRSIGNIAEELTDFINGSLA
jgi:hypothetical protein